MYGSIYFSYLLYPRRKPFGLELESNPGPLASKATVLTTRPCILGQGQRINLAPPLSDTERSQFKK